MKIGSFLTGYKGLGCRGREGLACPMLGSMAAQARATPAGGGSAAGLCDCSQSSTQTELGPAAHSSLHGSELCSAEPTPRLSAWGSPQHPSVCLLCSPGCLPLLLLPGALPKGFHLHQAVSASHHPGDWVGNCSVTDVLTPEQRQSTQSCWLKDSRSTGVRGDREAKAAHGIGGKEDPALETRVLWRRPNV